MKRSDSSFVRQQNGGGSGRGQALSRSPSVRSTVGRRRGSGNNNTSSSSSNEHNGGLPPSRKASSTRSASDPFANYTNAGPLLEKFSEDAIDIEQHITIVPNPRAKRRGSMADYAFPELHSNRGKNRPAKEPENLLILTRTKTDRNGRRHSVAVPLIPPPDGEKFEGGYHVERNPITGGARLVPPPAPGVSGGRRHSYNNTKLVKDMERLKVSNNNNHSGSASPSAGVSPATSQRLSPRPSTKRKSSFRRGSKGFLHFLDLAIAN